MSCLFYLWCWVERNNEEIKILRRMWLSMLIVDTLWRRKDSLLSLLLHLIMRYWEDLDGGIFGATATLSRTTLSIMTASIVRNMQDTQHRATRSITTLGETTRNAGCCFAECYAECCLAERCYAECRYADCRYAECRGASLASKRGRARKRIKANDKEKK